MASRAKFSHPTANQATGEPTSRGKCRTQAILRRMLKGLMHLDPCVVDSGRETVPTDAGALIHVALGGRDLPTSKVNVTRLMQRLDTDPKDYLEACALIYEVLGTEGGDAPTMQVYYRLHHLIEDRKQHLHLQEVTRGDEAPNRRPAETHPRTQASPEQKAALLAETIQVQSVRLSPLKAVAWEYTSAQIVEHETDKDGNVTATERLVFTRVAKALVKGGITEVPGF